MTLTLSELITQWKQRCYEEGMDPAEVPGFSGYLTEEELQARLIQYSEFIEVTTFFVEKFLAALTGSPMLICIFDAEGYVLDMGGNSAILNTVRTLGIVPGVQFGKTQMGPNAPALCLMLRQPLCLQGQEHHHEVIQGMACWAIPIMAEGGKRPVGAISIMTSLDLAHSYLGVLLATVTDSIEREIQLRKQNTQLQILNQVLVNTNYYGLIITDAEGHVIEMNAPIANLFEHGLIEAGVGSSVFEIGLVANYFERVMRSGNEVVGAELKLRTAGAAKHYLLDVVPIHDEQGMLIRVVGSLRDITELKTTEEVLRNTEKLVFAGRLAVSIAHEVRNPLTVVKGLLQYAGGKLAHHDLVMSELERMNLIVGEFMILGKPQAAQFKEESCVVILDEVLRIFGIQAAMNGLAITTEMRGDKPILCDRNQIKQVFLNILRNAQEAMPYGGKIQIELDVREDRQHIRFTDEGSGMSEEVQKRLGEPFLTTKPDGNGLGLMIVRKIIAAHQGTMSVESRIGEGTSVELCLP
ncbi:PAS domain S-box-containing protein [Paenibacillus phyllosphaerae]|uniref:histidine kinase n=1 Tax=Paenibacillus phyllosphaerae TaxID=274593 RepID=A0A7W5FQH1_9BACL|nr:ATP-binding protein [Paenibacillus phyllosphaerae]MBB3113247.1 PAS domain S-box-containing protein [Paenibacillus phyllosphaerae]